MTDHTDAHRTAEAVYAACNGFTRTSLDYMTHTRILTVANAGRTPERSDPIGWAQWALERRDDLPADTYAALTGPAAAAFGPIHPDDVRTARDVVPGLVPPDAWRRFPERSAS